MSDARPSRKMPADRFVAGLVVMFIVAMAVFSAVTVVGLVF